MTRTKTLEELVALGGMFYTLNGESWCDTPTDSWRFDPRDGLYHLYAD